MRESDTMTASNALIDGLTESMQPVMRRRPGREVMILTGIGLLQLIGTMSLLGENAVAVFSKDMIGITAKALMMAAATLMFVLLAFRSLLPTTPKQGKMMALAGALVMAFGVFTLDWDMGGSVGAALMPHKGIVCLLSSISFALPLFITLTLFMRGAAPTQPRMTALLIGMASGSWGVFVYGLQCPFTNIAYIALWYGGAIGLVTLAAAAILPRFSRW
ncbi:MAG: NrsF family protein [Pseudomonadota bacterium]